MVNKSGLQTDGKLKLEKIALCGIIGHWPLRGRCPKRKRMRERKNERKKERKKQSKKERNKARKKESKKNRKKKKNNKEMINSKTTAKIQ